MPEQAGFAQLTRACTGRVYSPLAVHHQPECILSCGLSLRLEGTLHLKFDTRVSIQCASDTGCTGDYPVES